MGKIPEVFWGWKQEKLPKSLFCICGCAAEGGLPLLGRVHMEKFIGPVSQPAQMPGQRVPQ